MLPLSFVANTAYPYDRKLEAALRFLDARRISDTVPLRTAPAHSDAYDAWLAQRRPKLRLVRGVVEPAERASA